MTPLTQPVRLVVTEDGTLTDHSQALVDEWAKVGYQLSPGAVVDQGPGPLTVNLLYRPDIDQPEEPRFNPPAHRIRRFGEPTHTTTYALADAPCGGKVRVYNDAYRQPVEVECDGNHYGTPHRFAIVVHEDEAGVPVCFFAYLTEQVRR